MTGRHGAVCAACWQKLRFIERPYCDMLGLPFSYDPGPGMLSAQAIAHPPVFARLRSAVIFDGAARVMVHGLKYKDRGDLAPTMAAWMERGGQDCLDRCDAIVPVPLHRTRFVLRKYNQAAELARHLAKRADKPYLPAALVRTKRTRRQVGLTARAREENVRAAFAVPPGREPEIFGKRVVLVDDVYTTGATVSAATRALKKAGAAEVSVLTFAMALAEII
ncbi:comF family protein [Rhizobium sp. NFR07]|nr:comF family protein [Rhizobium sp. NFR07]